MSARILGTAFFAAVLGTAPVMAQDRDPYVPAEQPPESFEGVQYVDSTGCAFIRAGFGGETNWVPRFTRDREPVCGLTPTLEAAGQTRVAETQPEAQPEEPPAAPAAQPPRQEQVASRPAAAPETPAAQVRTERRPSAAPEPERARTTRVVRSGQNYCANYDAIGQRATRSDRPVRCGPQLKHPVDGLRTDGPGGAVWQPQGGERPMPEGYRPVWKDDRLNPNRGRGTAAGDAQMRTVWTDTVPRQLVDDDPAAHVPYQTAATPKKATHRTKATVSSKGAATAAPQSAAAPAGSGDRFVQVGSFGEPSNAANTAARFENMGMPVRTTRVQSGGRTLQVVMIGPFASQADLAAALRAARGAGFGDAFTRG